MMKRVVALAALLGPVVAPAARADTKAACIESFEGGEELRVAGKLLEARKRFLACATASCSADVQRECMKELEQVDASLPSVVIRARDAQGHDLVRARATLDGAPRAMDGLAVSVDPGTHTVHIESDGCAPADDVILAQQGEKNRAVELVLRCTPAPAPPAPAERRTVDPLPFILAGVGVGGIAAFAFFGLQGKGQIEDIRATGCAPACDEDAVSTARTKLVVADVAGAIGIVALGAAAYVALAKPFASPTAPTVGFRTGPGGGSLVLRAGF